jgi:energy-converting hydrogenase Eha subunit H
MRERIQDSVAFIVLGATCTAGLFQATWWFAVVGACSLAILSLVERQYAGNRYGLIHRGIPDPILAFSSVLNGTIFSAAAFALGHITRVMWGL